MRTKHSRDCNDCIHLRQGPQEQKVHHGLDTRQSVFPSYNSISELLQPYSDCNGPGNPNILWGKLWTLDIFQLLYKLGKFTKANILGVCSNITGVGVHGKRVSHEHLLARDSFVLSSIHWWTVLGRNNECGSEVKPPGLNGQLTSTSYVTSGKSRLLSVPECGVYCMETAGGLPFRVVLRIK